jgi:2-iminobutanoate/2-iminopropanoate deaminase
VLSVGLSFKIKNCSIGVADARRNRAEPVRRRRYSAACRGGKRTVSSPSASVAEIVVRTISRASCAGQGRPRCMVARLSYMTVWLGGQTGSPNLNFEGQVREIFAELDKTIKAVGSAGLRDMVTMTVFINDVRLGDRLTEIRKETFKECFPGSALIAVSGFARPGILIEIQGMAVIGGK